jgi:hypothetical protein
VVAKTVIGMVVHLVVQVVPRVVVWPAGIQAVLGVLETTLTQAVAVVVLLVVMVQVVRVVPQMAAQELQAVTVLAVVVAVVTSLSVKVQPHIISLAWAAVVVVQGHSC